MNETNLRFPRVEMALIFLVWAGVLAWLILGGRYQYLIRPEFWILLLCGFGILFAFIVALFFHIHKVGREYLNFIIWVRMGVLLLPLFYLILAQDITLGSYAFKNRSTGTSFPKGLFRPKTSKVLPGDGKLTTLEILQYFHEFKGKRITTEGIVYRDEIVPENHFLVFRFLIVCCVADALPAGALVAHKEAESFKQDSWVRVEGILGLKIVEGLYFPLIEADNVTPIDPPGMPYLFQSFM